MPCLSDAGRDPPVAGGHDMTTTAASRKALGAYGETVAARRHLVERGMVLLDRNWRCREGELDLVLRDGDVLVACEVKTRRSDGVRVAARGRGRRPSWRGCTGWCGAGPRSTTCTPTTSEWTWSPCCGRRRGPASSTTSGGWSDAVRHLPHRRAHRGARATSSTSRPTCRRARSRPCWSAGPTPRSTRRGTAAGWPSSTAGSTGRRLATYDDPALTGRSAQARHPLRPGDRGRRARRDRCRPDQESLEDRWSSSAS